jgi:tetratricopeptide (TPR) repeat protein
MNKLIILSFIIFVMFINHGCGGSTLGSTGISTYTDPEKSLIDDAWYIYNKGNYASAKQKFTKMLTTDLSSQQKADTNCGLGFAVAQEEGILEAKDYFEKSAEYNPDAKVGLAAYYLSLADKTQFYKGIKELEELGIQNVDKKYTPRNNDELNSAKVHTLLGLLYYYSGRYNEAYEQFNAAKTINEPKPDEDIKEVTDSFITNTGLSK